MAVIFQVEIIMHLSITGESCVLERRCHVYYSSTLENKLVINSIKTVLQTIYQLYVKSGLFQKSYPIPTGSIKDVSKTSPKKCWNESLDEQDWSVLEDCNTVDEMVDIFTVNTNKALDKIAPFKTFQVKLNYRFGISPETKNLMKQRDSTRENIKKAKGSECMILMNL